VEQDQLNYCSVAGFAIIRGKLIGSTQLVSRRFAMIDDGSGFSLVPWRPVIEKESVERLSVSCAAPTFWQLG
jgi:hypothetical protein